MEGTDTGDVLARQAALHAEATAVLNDLGLLAHLGQVGEVVLVGSYPLDLMVWRDIDIYVYCNALSAERSFSALRPLASHPHVVRMNFDNWRGPNSAPNFPDGYYWGIRCRADAECALKVDLWFLPDDLPRKEIALTAMMERWLTPEARLAILSLKTIWHRLPSYGRGVASVDIYDAVLHHDVRMRAAFERYLRDRGKTVDAPG